MPLPLLPAVAAVEQSLAFSLAYEFLIIVFNCNFLEIITNKVF